MSTAASNFRKPYIYLGKMKVIQAICIFFSCSKAALSTSNSNFSVFQIFFFCLETLLDLIVSAAKEYKLPYLAG